MSIVPASPKSKKRDALSPSIPYSAEAEKAVLGCMLAQPGEVIDEACDTLVPEDFFVPAHGTIFKALKAMWDGQEAIDVMTMHQYLTDIKVAEEIGSPGIIGELLVGFATHLNVGSYIRIVKDKALLRAVQRAAYAMLKDVDEMPDSVASVLDRAESSIFQVTNFGVTGSTIMDARACIELFRQQRREIEAGTYQNRLKTGIDSIDHGNGGFPSPGYVVIAAGPGVGKTALALNLLEFWCPDGIGVGVLSLEMTIQQIVKRMIASTAQMDSRRLNTKLHDWEQQHVAVAENAIMEWPLWIDDTAYMTIDDLRKKARQMVSRGARVLIIDYIQLMKGTDNRDKRNEQLAEASRGIKLIAKELGILIVVLAGINKDGMEEVDKGHELEAHHIADSSAMHKDSDVVLLMWKRPEDKNAPAEAIPVQCKLDKERDGQMGLLNPLLYNSKELRFT